jgi:negative regulator of replication initiation
MKFSLKDKISNEKPTIEITNELTVTVNNSFKKVLAMQELLASNEYKSDVERMAGVLETLLDKKDVKSINDLDLPFNEYLTIVKAVIAAATGQPLSEIEERFQE